MAVLFDDVTVITMNARREILTGASVAVQADRIAAVGARRELAAAFPKAERLDARGMLLMPGLVDTHVHTAQAMIRGCADDLGLLDWLGKRVWVLQGNYSAEDGRASAALCALEMIKSGTTTFLECMLAERYGFDGVAEVVLQSGLRGAIAKIVMDLPSYAEAPDSMHRGMVESAEASFEEALALHERWEGAAEGRIQVWFGPRPPGGCTPALYRRMMQAAAERGMGVTVHLAEVREDIEHIRREHGLSAIEYARSVGMVGPRVLLVHVIWVGEDEIRLLAETGTHVTHNPLSNSKLASGIAPIPEMLAAGVNVGLGTDGGPSSNDYDLVRALRWASYLHKARRLDPTLMPVEQAIEMATVNGARAVGWQDRIGSLEPGKRADFVVFDLDRPHLTPAPNPLSALVCAGTGKDVHMVVIDGKVVVQDGQVLTLDQGRILAEARERSARLYHRAGIEVRPRWPVV